MTDAITRDNYVDTNARAIDGWNADGWEWGTPITHEDYSRACQGDWEMLLTPTKPVPHEWYPADMTGLRVLGLACGGAQQMPIFAALGAECTVLDYTPSQLESERMVAQREGYEIEVVRADMSKPLPFEDASFDMIFHPVSNCYIEEVKPLWLECNRILKPGGRLLAGLDNGFGYVFDYPDEERAVYSLPFNPLVNPEHMAALDLVEDGIQFSHTLEDQIRGQLQSGFQLVDCYEDTYGEGRLHEMNIPTFWATYAVKPL